MSVLASFPGSISVGRPTAAPKFVSSLHAGSPAIAAAHELRVFALDKDERGIDTVSGCGAVIASVPEYIQDHHRGIGRLLSSGHMALFETCRA